MRYDTFARSNWEKRWKATEKCQQEPTLIQTISVKMTTLFARRFQLQAKEIQPLSPESQTFQTFYWKINSAFQTILHHLSHLSLPGAFIWTPLQFWLVSCLVVDHHAKTRQREHRLTSYEVKEMMQII